MTEAPTQKARERVDGRCLRVGGLNNLDANNYILAKSPSIPNAKRCSKMFVQRGHSLFCTRNVPALREHGKMARTLLAAF